MNLGPRSRRRITGRANGPLAAGLVGTYLAAVVIVTMLSAYWLARDASGLSSIWIMFLTAPTSFVIMQLTEPLIPPEGLGDLNVPVLIIESLLAGGLQAWLGWLILRGPRRTTNRITEP